MNLTMFDQLMQMSQRPEPFSVYSADRLWTDEHISSQMLACHLDPELDLASRNHAFVERSARWMVDRFDLGPGKHVADFGCGPGLYASRLAAAGARVLGIDFSPRSIQHARAEADAAGLEIDYRLQSYLDFESEQRFDLILMIMGDFCALSGQQRSRLLGIFREHIAPGGAIVFDAHSLAYFERFEPRIRYAPRLMDGFWSAAPYVGFHHGFAYPEEKVLLDRFDIFEAQRSFTVYNWLQCFSPESLAAELAEAGLECSELLGDVAGAPYDPGADLFAVAVGPSVISSES